MKKYSIFLFVTLFIIFSYVILDNNAVLIFYGDDIRQMYPIYNHLTSLITSGQLSFWDTSIGFGANLFSFFFNAPLGSIFLYIYVLVNNFISLEHFFFLADLVRLFIIGIFSYLWISYHTKNEKVKYISSSILTFSGWVVYWFHYSTYIDSYMWIVILLYLFTEIRQNRKIVFFVLSIFLSILNNLYMFYIFSWLLFFYFIYLYVNENQEYCLKSFLISFLNVFKYYIVGVLLASFMILPSIHIIMTSPRISANSQNLTLFHFDFAYLYELFSSYFSPVITDYNTNFFYTRGSIQTISMNYYYSFLITPYMFSLLFFIKKKLNKVLIISYLIIFLANFIIPFRILLSGNTDVRWQIILVFLNVLMITETSQYIDVIKNYQKFFSYLLNIVVISSLFYFSTRNNLSNPAYSASIKLFAISAVIVQSFYLFIFMNWNQRYIMFPLYLVLIVESMISIDNRLYLGLNKQYISYDELDTIYDESNTYQTIMESDESYYRIDGPVDSSNQSLYSSFPGFTFYLSVYNHETRSLLDHSLSSGWDSNFQFSKFLIKSLFGSKYYIANVNDEIPYGYHLYENASDKLIYLNSLETGLGYASNRVISEKSLENIDSFLKGVYMFNYIVDNSLSKQFATSADDLLPSILGLGLVNSMVDIPKEDGYFILDYSQTNPYTMCKIEWYKGDNVISAADINEYSYVAVKNNPGADRVFFYCNSLYNANDYTPYNVYFLSNQMIDELYNHVQGNDFFYDVIKTNLGYTAKINVTENESLVFTNIAFDKGWTVKVNGQKVDIQKVNYGFVGFNLDKGEYEVKFSYIPPYFKLGSFISLFTLILMIGFKFSLRRKNQV